jgi:DNA-binding MarR family transcriptional regulator
VCLKDAHALIGMLMTTSQYMVVITARAMAETGERLTVPQFRTLVILEARGPMSLTALADELDVATSTALRMCERLEKRGLAVRGASPTDKRASVILLTLKGRKVVARVHRARAELLLETIREIPEDRQGDVIEALGLLVKASGQRPAAASDLPPL